MREFIRKFIEDGNIIFSDAFLQNSKVKVAKESAKENSTTNSSSNDNISFEGIEQEIVDILDEYVKPAVASDGGHIAFDSFDKVSKTVKVILQGACSGCPSSTVTLKNGIETMLRDMLQGRVMHVEAING